jgi:hypothetical protein
MLATFSIYVYSRKEGVVGQTIKSLPCTKNYMHPILEKGGIISNSVVPTETETL